MGQRLKGRTMTKKNGKAKGTLVRKTKKKKGWFPLYKFDFNRTEYEYLINECCFTDDERKIFDLRRKGRSVTYITLELNLSESTITRRIKSINKKICKAIKKYWQYQNIEITAASSFLPQWFFYESFLTVNWCFYRLF